MMLKEKDPQDRNAILAWSDRGCFIILGREIVTWLDQQATMRLLGAVQSETIIHEGE
jgi:hypothetical protein